MMNSVNIIGNLTRDIELRFTANGKAVANFSIAVPDAFNKEHTNFFNVVVWGKQGENCANYLGKGKKAGITGRLQQRVWETKEGQKRYEVEIVADRVEFLTPKSQDEKPADDGWGDLGREVDDDEFPF